MSKVLITGICGFVGAHLARGLQAQCPTWDICGVDNLSRRGSELNFSALRQEGFDLRVGDVREGRVLRSFGHFDWLIDAAANPSVLAGVGGGETKELLEHNLYGTVEMLEACRAEGATFTLLSTSRVYSIPELNRIPLREVDAGFVPDESDSLPAGMSREGLSEEFSTQAPISLYGSSKLCSENLALEYGAAFGFPVWINRCGVLAGAGQFGRADQGIFSFWIHSWAQRKPLRFLGFGGRGLQVRDCLHPEDLVPLLLPQFRFGENQGKPQIVHAAGGTSRAMSLAQLSKWCETRFGDHEVIQDGTPRPFDIPWLVMDSGRAEKVWNWRPQRSLESILEEIAEHARAHPDWLKRVS